MKEARGDTGELREDFLPLKHWSFTENMTLSLDRALKEA